MSERQRAKIIRSTCGWCYTNRHSQCTGVTQRFYIGTTGKDKNKVVYIPMEYNECDCPSKHARPDVRNNKPVETLEAL